MSLVLLVCTGTTPVTPWGGDKHPWPPFWGCFFGGVVTPRTPPAPTGATCQHLPGVFGATPSHASRYWGLCPPFLAPAAKKGGNESRKNVDFSPGGREGMELGLGAKCQGGRGTGTCPPAPWGRGGHGGGVDVGVVGFMGVMGVVGFVGVVEVMGVVGATMRWSIVHLETLSMSPTHECHHLVTPSMSPAPLGGTTLSPPQCPTHPRVSLP